MGDVGGGWHFLSLLGGVLGHTVIIQDVLGHYPGLEGFAATPEGFS